MFSKTNIVSAVIPVPFLGSLDMGLNHLSNIPAIILTLQQIVIQFQHIQTYNTIYLKWLIQLCNFSSVQKYITTFYYLIKILVYSMNDLCSFYIGRVEAFTILAKVTLVSIFRSCFSGSLSFIFFKSVKENQSLGFLETF